jgi:hypothetical protein
MKAKRRLADMLWHYHFLVEVEGWSKPAFMEEVKSAEYASHDEEGILLALLESLPKGSHIESIDDLRAILRDHYSITNSDAIHQGPTEEQKNEMEQNFQRLVEMSSYEFEAPIFAPFTRFEGDPVPSDLAIGGGANLRFVHRRLEEIRGPLEPGWKRAGPEPLEYVTFLSGRLDAVHWTGALREVLTLCEEVTGTHLALDLAKCSSPTAQHVREVQGAEAWLCVSLSRAADGWAKSVTLSWQQVDATSRTVGFWPESPSVYLEGIFDAGDKAVGVDVVESNHEDPPAKARRDRDYAVAPFSLGGDDAKRLRTAARFLTKAVRAESPADSYLFMGTCLEALLVSGGEAIGERLSDAVALILGRSFGERAEMKERVKKLYHRRSRYVHGGQYDRNERERMLCLDIVKRVLAAELKHLEDGEG